MAAQMKPPCPPTPISLIAHYARSIYVSDADDTKMHFLRLLLAECEGIREGADPNQVVHRE